VDEPDHSWSPLVAQLLTIDEVTSWLRVSRSTFYRAVREGTLPAFKVRGEWRVEPRDVEAFIARRKAETNGNTGGVVSEGVSKVSPGPPEGEI